MYLIIYLTLNFLFNTNSFHVNFFRTRNFKNNNINYSKLKNCNGDYNNNNILSQISLKNKYESNFNYTTNYSLPYFQKIDDSWDDGEIPWDIDLILPSNPYF